MGLTYENSVEVLNIANHILAFAFFFCVQKVSLKIIAVIRLVSMGNVLPAAIFIHKALK